MPCAGLSYSMRKKSKTKKHPQQKLLVLYMAEREGFEPSRALGALHDFQSCALDQLSHLSTAVA